MDTGGKTGRMGAALLLVAAVLTGAASTAAAQTDSADVFISELHYDNASTDTGEFVEVTGPAGTDLTGWSIVLYNGNGGAPYDTESLDGVIDDEGAGQGAVGFAIPGIQNGAPDGVALVDATDTVVQFISYEGDFAAVGGPADGLTSTDIGVAETGSTPVGQSVQLIDGTWTGPAPASPGNLNGEATPETVTIHDIQGSSDASPLVGQTVTISGIVVGDFQEIVTDDADDAPLQGFFVQEEDADADADPATSEGVFVFAPDAEDVEVGQLVEVTGSVTEFFDLTEINNVTDITIVSTGNPLPTPATPTLPMTTEDWEAIEGMSVEFAQTLTVTGTFPQGSFGEIQLSANGVQDHPNQTNAVGDAAGVAQREANLANRVILDDGEAENESFPNGLSTWNPTPTPYLGGADNTLRSGDVVNNLAGVVFYDFGEYEIQPVNVADPTDPDGAVSITRAPRPGATPDVGGTLTVASFNVLNYFTTIDNGEEICGTPDNAQRCRGADNQAEFDLQSAKIATAVAQLDADIVGLIELQNSGGDEAIADLVSKVNALSGRTYEYVPTGFIGSDAIAVGFIYDGATVSPEGAFAVLDSSVSPAYIDTRNRPALAQTFTQQSNGETVTVVVNHLKSKGSSCDTLDNPGDASFGVVAYGAGEDVEDPNLQGNCNLTRTAAATVLGQWANANPTGTASNNVLLLGDLNAYANEDPITELETQGYTDLVERFAGSNSWAQSGHSYVFDGEHGTLDYALANAPLDAQITGAATWHINADEPFALDYQDFNPDGQAQPDEWKSSDHDPVVIGLDLASAPVGPTCRGLEATIVGTDGRDILFGTSGPDVIVSLSGSDIVFGFGGDDIICLGNGSDLAIGGAGDDQIFGENGRDRLIGQSGADTLDGGKGRDVLIGDSGSDQLIGGSGRDTLLGGSGPDQLDGGRGRDRADGGRGTDSCINVESAVRCEQDS